MEIIADSKIKGHIDKISELAISSAFISEDFLNAFGDVDELVFTNCTFSPGFFEHNNCSHLIDNIVGVKLCKTIKSVSNSGKSRMESFIQFKN